MKWIEAEILNVKQWSQDIFSIFLAPASAIRFEAGQFTYLAHPELPNHFRPYSFVNPPNETRCEFLFRYLPQGFLVKKLALMCKHEILLVSPEGKGQLVLSKIGTGGALWMFASGTGIGPFLSILRAAEVWKVFGKVVLVHTVRSKSELTHELLIKSLLAKFPMLHYCPVVTSTSGRIPDLLRSGLLEAEIGLKFEPVNSKAMLCGNPNMINDTSEVLLDRGAKLNSMKEPCGQILLERYWKG